MFWLTSSVAEATHSSGVGRASTRDGTLGRSVSPPMAFQVGVPRPRFRHVNDV